MTEIISQKEWKKYILAAIISCLVFVSFEIIPLIKYSNEHPYGGKAISKQEASTKAINFAKQHLGVTVRASKPIHQSKRLFVGYLDKEKLTANYDQQYDSHFPNDFFQVRLTIAGMQETPTVDVHMYSGEIVGWHFPKLQSMQTDEEKATKPLDKQTQIDAITGELLRYHLHPKQLQQWEQTPDGLWKATSSSYNIGEATMEVTAQAALINDRIVVTKYASNFIPPDDYITYVKQQDKLAMQLSQYGYLLMSIVLAILAIIYAIVYRQYTSFKYGIMLTAIFFLTYLIMNLNMIDGMFALEGAIPSNSAPFKLLMIVVMFILTVMMAFSVYISIFAGEGLWRVQKRSIWPKRGEQGYGNYIWRSMILSYLFAFIMLGLQPVIFWILSKVIGTWSTSDVSTSPYNMSVLWLMPVLAWAAAISEEAIFRLFGIGLFRRWFRNTFAAAILPTIFWALGHVTYPFYPATTRLIELIIIGLLFSFIFVRYGFPTAVFTHAIFNTIAVSSSLYMMGSTTDKLSATFFLILPVIIAFLLRKWDGTRRNSGKVPLQRS
ncbi:CPBP family intramembrane glutamic endopeptidase [Paenibacillus yanchengensis]|uniref:CPBP family intramembrane glutamic endopeptidase n=1 Tax=Paenibacillus yanchengensis TaxID=2035833 RepID=A0ABW4YPR7_9BACL